MLSGAASASHASPQVYCIVPRELAGKLHDALQTRFEDDPSVSVVVDLRERDRRQEERRRRRIDQLPEERRRIRSAAGRRVSEGRAQVVRVEPPSLPRRARRYGERLRFVERRELDPRAVEDADSARLVTRFQAGDEHVFSDLYLRYFDRVHTYLRIALDDPHEAEDAAQQIFTQALQALPRYELRTGTPFRGWLFSIARHEALAQLRRQRRVELEDPGVIDRRRALDVDKQALRASQLLSDPDLLFMIERLPDAQRQAVILRHLLGLPTDEIAAFLDRTPVAVRKLEHRGLRFLERRLDAVGRRPRRAQRRKLARLRRLPVLRARRFALASSLPGRRSSRTYLRRFR